MSSGKSTSGPVTQSTPPSLTAIREKGGENAKASIVPVFIAALALVVLLFGGIEGKGRPRRALLVLHAALLAGCLGLGLRFGPFRNADSPVAVLAGMLAVAAMATQNALVKLALVKSPSTAVMTTNTTLFAIDTGELLLGWHGRRKGDAEAAKQFSAARERLKVLVPLGLGFIIGTAAGALGYLWFGLSCLLLVLALLVALVVWASRRSAG